MELAELAQSSHSMRDTAIERLYEAATLGSVQLLNTLIREDPNIIQKYLVSNSNKSETPLHVSVMRGHLEFTRLLLDRKPELVVEVDALQRTPLHLASANGNVEMVRALLEKNTGACLIRDLNGMVPLHHSATKGHIQVMQDLIHARPQSVRTKLGDGRNILHLCVNDNQLEAMRLLIQSVIDDKDFLNAVDNNGNTILDLSMLLRQIEMVRYLLNIPGIEVAGTRSSSNIEIAETTSAQEGAQELEVAPPIEEKEKMKNKGNNWSDKMQVHLLVATVIATVTFQCLINPPGGVLQDELKMDNLPFSKDKVFTRGTSVMLYHPRGRQLFQNFLLSNTVSFTASVVVILLILLQFSMNNRIVSRIVEYCCSYAMCAAVQFLIHSYTWAVSIVNNGMLTDEQASDLLNGMNIIIDPSWLTYLGFLPLFIGMFFFFMRRAGRFSEMILYFLAQEHPRQ